MQLIENVMVNFSIHSMKNLHGAMAERLELVKVSIANAEAAQAKLGDCCTIYQRNVI